MADRRDLSFGRQQAAMLAPGNCTDSSLPALCQFLDPVEAGPLWQRWTVDSPSLRGTKLAAVLPLRYRPGRRCTLAVSLLGSEDHRVYVKIYRPGKARRRRRDLAGLLSRPLPPGLDLPRLLGGSDGDGVLILQQVRGTSLEEGLNGGAQVSAGAASGAEAAGVAIARFHGLADRVPGALSMWNWADEMQVVEASVARLPDRGDRGNPVVAEALERLWGLGGSFAGEPVLLHRDLHPQQILVADERAGLVDLDLLALGAPEIDLGNLLAHLDLFGLHSGGDASRHQAVERALLRSYFAHRQLAAAALAAARGAALLRLAGLYAGAPFAALQERLLGRVAEVLGDGA